MEGTNKCDFNLAITAIELFLNFQQFGLMMD